MLCEGYLSKLVAISQIPNTLAGVKKKKPVCDATHSVTLVVPTGAGL